MPNYKKVSAMLARGGVSQQDIAAICECNKRDVSSATRYVRESGSPAEQMALMSEKEIRERTLPHKRRVKRTPTTCSPTWRRWSSESSGTRS